MDRWLYNRYRQNLHRPEPRPRAHPIEAPMIWAAHLLAWSITQHQRLFRPNTTLKPPTGGFFMSEEDS